MKALEHSKALPRDCSAVRSEKASDGRDAMWLKDMNLCAWEVLDRALGGCQSHQLCEESERAGWKGCNGVVIEGFAEFDVE